MKIKSWKNKNNKKMNNNLNKLIQKIKLKHRLINKNRTTLHNSNQNERMMQFKNYGK